MKTMRTLSYLKVVVAIAACLATFTFFAACEKEEAIDPDAPVITAFSFDGQAGDAVIDPQKRTVKATAACGTNLASLTPAFTLSPAGTTAKVDHITQTSGTTAVNFSEPVTYILTTPDGETANWTVSIVLPDDCPDVKKYITYNQPVTAYFIEYNGGAIAANQNNNAGNYGTVTEAYENKKYACVEWYDYWRCNVVSTTSKGYFTWESWNKNGPNVWMEWDDQAGTDSWIAGRWHDEEYPLDRFAFFVSKSKLGGGFLWFNPGGLNSLGDVARNPDEATMPDHTDVTQYYVRSEKVCNILCDVYTISTITFWVDPNTGFTLKVDGYEDGFGNYEVTRLVIGAPDWNGEHLHYNAAGGDIYMTP